MSYEPFDEMPVVHWGEWPETRECWQREGFPVDDRKYEYLGAYPKWIDLQNEVMILRNGIYPEFDEEVHEETDTYRVVRAKDGTLCKEWKTRSCIPQFIDFTLKPETGWEEYKRRLQPDAARISTNLREKLRDIEARNVPVCFNAGSLIGWIRNWMGIENLAYLMYDNRDLLSEMVMTIADLVCWAADQVLPHVSADFAHGWEDICGRAGPLISPEVFDECVVPGYQKIRNKVESYGIDLYSVDCDGDITALVGYWLDAGVNMMFPLEVGPFKGDALRLRKTYGRNLRLFGNFDKIVLEKSTDAVEQEVQRLKPLMKDGGFIIMPDHLIQPGVSLDNYRWYLDHVRKIRL